MPRSLLALPLRLLAVVCWLAAVCSLAHTAAADDWRSGRATWFDVQDGDLTTCVLWGWEASGGPWFQLAKSRALLRRRLLAGPIAI
jgi:hypothetical protein